MLDSVGRGGLVMARRRLRTARSFIRLVRSSATGLAGTGLLRLCHGEGWWTEGSRGQWPTRGEVRAISEAMCWMGCCTPSHHAILPYLLSWFRSTIYLRGQPQLAFQPSPIVDPAIVVKPPSDRDFELLQNASSCDG